MDQLQQAREIINEVDQQMAALFVRRMEACRMIAGYKKERALPIYDAAREQVVIEKNSAYVEDEQIRDYYVRFLHGLMDLTKQYQFRLIEGMKVAYAGVKGAFANIAATRIFPGGICMGYEGFQAAYDAVVKEECDCVVLPIENSFVGEVGQVMDLMFHGQLHINGIYTLPVSQNLLGVPGSDRSRIRKVLSHPQALSQCEEYIHRYGWDAIPESNTAIAAQKVARLGDPTIAAIASAATADLYGLEILEHDINVSSTNTTKFAVFSRVENKTRNLRDNKFILMFTVNDEAGALARAIQVIASHGFNMKALRSRPVKEVDWQYYFYVEVEGDEDSREGQKMLEELAGVCDTLKVAGHYTAQICLN
ncbi:MAG: chorismate mutase [Firmicutes bacterium]|nr:chorismate mutase [Bacillota bacterium]